MPTTITTCPACRRDDRKTHPDLTATQRIAAAIVGGSDLGGIFELANEFAKARVDVGLDADPKGLAATAAAVRILGCFDHVAVAFARLAPCRVCELRKRLAFLIDVATNATDDSRRGAADPDDRKVVDACEELAHYAGDDHPDEGATRAVLELARNVFLAAYIARSPNVAP